jgi:CRP-like cAMP-binding protein
MNETYQIENVPLFANLPLAQLDTLRKDAVRQIYKAGETIFNHGDLPEHLYIVEEGVIDIVLPAKGEEIILATLEAGSFFGELSVFDSHPRTATARAMGDASLICIPLSSIAALTNRSPTAARQFMSVIIHRLRTADELLARVQLKNINEVIDEQMTFGGKVADLVARFGGSWIFIGSTERTEHLQPARFCPRGTRIEPRELKWPRGRRATTRRPNRRRRQHPRTASHPGGSSRRGPYCGGRTSSPANR